MASKGEGLMLPTEYQRRRHEESLLAAQSVKDKIASGVYALEETKCFCGADDDQEIKKVDRDGIPHRIVVCKACALARANPRMTAEAYGQFYNNEYRKFTYRWLDTDPLDRDHELELIRQKQLRVGDHIHELLVNEDIEFPQVVVDFGCYVGGMLDHFKERGATTYGIEINEEAAQFASARGHTIVPSIDALIEQGVKADLVIMQDVIEHLLDLREAKKVGQILKPEGKLFVFTPGMFRTDPRNYWQLAHTWYFVANTFGWMMEELGFTPSYIDEDISSFWEYAGNMAHAEPPSDWVEYIVDEAEGKEERRLPPFRGVCKFTKKLLYDNMRRNFATKTPDIYEISQSRKGPVAILGGGPSVDGQVEELRKLKAQGVPVIAIARMYPWAVQHGVIPDYVVSLDCMEEQEKGFSAIQKDTTHLFASVTRPELMDMVKATGAPCYLFDSRDDRKIKGLRRDAGYNACTVINSGGTVVITCMSVAFNLGFDELHIFGFDCMFPNHTTTHATGIAGENVPQKVLTVDVDGETVLTSPSFIEFARQALDLFSIAHEEKVLSAVHIYGDSLVKKMWPDLTWHEEEAA